MENLLSHADLKLCVQAGLLEVAAAVAPNDDWVSLRLPKKSLLLTLLVFCRQFEPHLDKDRLADLLALEGDRIFASYSPVLDTTLLRPRKEYANYLMMVAANSKPERERLANRLIQLSTGFTSEGTEPPRIDDHSWTL